MLAGKHPSGAADARLHLVEDQQDAVPIAQFAQSGQEPVRRHEVTALALDRLHQDGGHFARQDVVTNRTSSM